MRKHLVVIGAYAASFAMLASPALAQNSSGTPDTYQAARAAGASAQKVAPPNLYLPADMGGGMYGKHPSNADVPNGAPNNTGMHGTSLTPSSTTGGATTPNTTTNSNADNPNGTPNNTGTHGTSLTPTNAGQTAPMNNTNSNTISPNTKSGS
ncbi:MAG TPA: hypothetical protein VMD07_06980 [Candidatus Acidoferrales bacterium]|nr:hypothetical protein [Candidatus Acidoferrales bacterium]